MPILFINQSIQKKDHEGYHNLLKTFNSLHPNGQVVQLNKQTFAQGLQKEAQSQPKRLYMAGGDGTVNYVVNQFLAHHPTLSKVQLGIIPYGSANGLATDLALPTSPQQALEQLSQTTHTVTADVPIIETPNNTPTACVHFADAGLNAELVQRADNNTFEGMAAYAVELPSAFFNRETRNISVKAYRETYQWEGNMLVIALARKLGSQAVINPTGKLHDGLFEVGVIKPLSLPDVFNVTINMFGNPNQNFEWMHMKSLSEAEINIDKPTHFQIDGEYMGKVKHIKISLHTQKLTWLVTDQCPYLQL